MALRTLNKRSLKSTKVKSKRIKRLEMIRDSALSHGSYAIAKRFQNEIDESVV